MKITSDGVKATAYIAVGLVAVYAAYRVYKIGDSAKTAIVGTYNDAEKAFDDAAKAVGDFFGIFGKYNDAEKAFDDAAKAVGDFFGIGKKPSVPDAAYPEPPAVRRANEEANRIDEGLLENYESILNTSGVSALIESNQMWYSSPQDYSPSAVNERAA